MFMGNGALAQSEYLSGKESFPADWRRFSRRYSQINSIKKQEESEIDKKPEPICEKCFCALINSNQVKPSISAAKQPGLRCWIRS